MEILEKTYAHMTTLENEVLRKECKNQHKLCAFWSAIGECDKVRMGKKCSTAVHYNCALHLLLLLDSFTASLAAAALLARTLRT